MITKVAQEIDASAGGNEDNRFQGAEEVCSDWSSDGIDGVVGKGPLEKISRLGLRFSD